MKHFWKVAVAIAIGLILFIGIPHRNLRRAIPGAGNVSSNVASTAATSHASSPAPATTSFRASNPAMVSGPIAMRAASPSPLTNQASSVVPTRTVLENIRSAIRLYGTAFGGNPVGNNAEITGALNGNNPKQINFIGNEAGAQINDRGELVDSWGTPFFFHQLSGSETEIRSAGPDRKMWTTDDLIVK